MTALAVATTAVVLSCGAARLPSPAYVGQPTAALEHAAFPPPPARVEYVPPIPNENAVWIDGEWTWQGRRWAWRLGRWVVPPANARYSPWTDTRDALGTLYVAEGVWRGPDGGALPDPKPLAVARTNAGPVVDPEGTTVPAAPNLRPGALDRSYTADSEDSGSPETPSGATPTGSQPKSATVTDGGEVAGDAAIADASVADVVTQDAQAPHEPHDASGRRATGSSTRMGDP